MSIYATSAPNPVKVSEAVLIHLKLKGKVKLATFHRAAERSCGYVIDVAGGKGLTAYTKSDANNWNPSEGRMTPSSPPPLMIVAAFLPVQSVPAE